MNLLNAMILGVDLFGFNVEDLEWYQMGMRAVVVYVIALIFIRLAGMRSFGTNSAFDVVITITMGAMLSRAISGHYPFVPTLTAALVLALCHRLIAFLTCRSKFIQKITEGRPVMLYESGRLHKHNLVKHSITIQDVEKTLREQGLDNLKDVKTIMYEHDGKISVVKLKH